MPRQSPVRTGFRWLLALIYLAAGVIHIRSPGGFVAITPDWVPSPHAVVFWTGVAEIAGAIGLMIPRLRRAAGIGLALYALCVWPANLNHAINDIAIGGNRLPWAYHGPRLMLQPLIIWWALWVGGVTDWPFRKRR
ncbi:DoxX family protein [Sphingomonas ursincola]|uniref:DoxX family protein n=1 Tax=Sphingomonas ursincola TaxID=56361 RepID=UPI0015E7A8F2